MAGTISQAAVAGLTCSRCLARPGQPCVTTTGVHIGSRLSMPHAVRTAALYGVWRSAFREGMEQQAQIIRERLEATGYCTGDAELMQLCRTGWL